MQVGGELRKAFIGYFCVYKGEELSCKSFFPIATSFCLGFWHDADGGGGENSQR